MNRTEKEEQVASLKRAFEKSEIVVATHYSGMTMQEMTDLRSRMLEAGASFKVTKNRLTRLALKDTNFEPLTDLMTGPIALAYSADPVAAAKTTVNFSKDNEKLIILGGVFDGKTLDVDDVKKLAKLPSLVEVRAQIVGMINTPATRIAGVLSAPAGQLARVVGADGAKRDEAA